MIKSTFYLIFFVSLMALTPLHAGQVTLSTYYPAPTGNYTRLQGTGFKLMPSTQSMIQTMYKCSFVSTDCSSYGVASPCPCSAGLMYYDTTLNGVYYSDGSQWLQLNATATVPCVTRRRSNYYSASRQCQAGETLTGGGIGNTPDPVYGSYPIDSAGNPADSSHPATGWECIGAYGSDLITCFAICCKFG